MQRLNYDDFINFGSIKELDSFEKKYYLEFLEKSYLEDFETSKNIISLSPKWSIISGYYAMHNITKYYLALKFNKKIGLPDVHEATINATKELIRNKDIKNLIDRAITEFDDVIPIFYSLVSAKKERKNLQYYSNSSENLNKLTLEKANYFLLNIVEKYIKLIELMIMEVKDEL